MSTIGANPMSLPTSSILNSTLPLSRVVSGGNNTGGSGGPGGTAADGIGLFRRLSVGFGTSRVSCRFINSVIPPSVLNFKRLGMRQSILSVSLFSTFAMTFRS